MNSIIVITQSDLLRGITVDTRIDIRVTEITDAGSVQAKLTELFGSRGDETADGIFHAGSDSLFKDRYCYGDLLHIMGRLTGEGGCPWDVAQTHESIRINAVEEAYELCAAIDNRDMDNMLEETGDVLLQAVFHANIAERSGEFTTADVIDRLCKKLVGRHTHIFGDTKASNADEALQSWEKAKAAEKKPEDARSKIEALGKAMPAMLYAQKAVKKLEKAGLVNEAQPVTAAMLLSAAAGAARNSVDGEVELRREVDRLIGEFFEGRKTILK